MISSPKFLSGHNVLTVCSGVQPRLMARVFQKPNVHNVYHMKGELLWYGHSGIVELLEGNVVQKSPLPEPDYEESRKDIELESEMYRLLGRHDRLTAPEPALSTGLTLS
jgi:hypothetical protein